MQNIQASSLIADLEKFRRNPMAVQNSVYNLLGEATEGRVNIIDPSNPVSLLLESSAVIAADTLGEVEAVTRRQYPKLVTNEEDLFGHISDMEYIGVWGLPGTNNFYLTVSVDELRTLAVADSTGTFSKVTIPRETEVTVAGITFGFIYPIDIRIAASGAISVLYDTSEVSPLRELSTNVLSSSIGLLDGMEKLIIEIPASQYQVTTQNVTASNSMGYSGSFPVNNYLYYCRVYYSDGSGGWVEMSTTHSGRIYDAAKPTATLKLHDGMLDVKVPEIYFNTGQISNKLRIDIYTTRGDITLNLDEYPATSVNYSFRDFSPVDNGRYSSVLSKFTTLSLTGAGILSGGSNGLTYSQLKDRVVSNSTSKPAPVTDLDLRNTVTDKGFDISNHIDNITDRTYLLSREMTSPSDTLASAPVGTVNFTYRLDLGKVSAYDTISDHGTTLTMMPNTLFKLSGTGIELMSDFELSAVNALNKEELITYFNDAELYYSPYLISIDKASKVMDYYMYDINNPAIEGRTFKEANENVSEKATIDAIGVSRTDTGYLIQVAVASAAGHELLDINNTGLQMAFTPPGSNQRVYLDGTRMGKDDYGRNRFQFPLITEFEIDANKQLQLENFNMVVGDTLAYGVLEKMEFEFFHYLHGLGLSIDKRIDIQEYLGEDFAPANAMLITHETVDIQLFEFMDGLVRRSRSAVGYAEYETWITDIYRTYEEDVYLRDGNNFLVLEEENDFEPQLLHAKGSLYKEDGEPVILHRKGSFKLDNEGNKIPVSSNNTQFYMDLVLFDGRYLFIDEETGVEYRNQFPRDIASWLNTEIKGIDEDLLAKTDLWFTPKITKGTIRVSESVGNLRNVEAEVPVAVDIFLNKVGYDDNELRSTISSTVKTAVLAELNKQRISTSALLESLRALLPDEVLAIKVYPLTSLELDAFVIEDEFNGCSLAKRLETRPDGTLALVDDLAIDYIRHM